jgi:chemotaxis response regulator CheB
MKRRTFLSALVGAGTVAATTSYIARHMPTGRKTAWLGVPAQLNQQSLERMLEAMKTDFVDRGKAIVVRPTKMLVTSEEHARYYRIYGSSGL